MNKQTIITINLKDYMSVAQQLTELILPKNAITSQYINALNGRKRKSKEKIITVQKKLINEHEAKEFNMF